MARSPRFHRPDTLDRSKSPRSVATSERSEGEQRWSFRTTGWQTQNAVIFTFNALYAGPDLRIFAVNDLGLQDLARGRVRFMGTAAHRIHEDYLRFLRYFRMFAWFGGQKHDRVNLNAIAKALPGLQQVSGERLKAD